MQVAMGYQGSLEVNQDIPMVTRGDQWVPGVTRGIPGCIRADCNLRYHLDNAEGQSYGLVTGL
jgi:hypothetical protein